MQICIYAGLAVVTTTTHIGRHINRQLDHWRQCMAGAQSGLRAVPLLLRNLVVAAAEKLDEADAVAERIGQAGDAAPSMRLDLALNRRARRARAGARGRDVG